MTVLSSPTNKPIPSHVLNKTISFHAGFCPLKKPLRKLAFPMGYRINRKAEMTYPRTIGVSSSTSYYVSITQVISIAEF